METRTQLRSLDRSALVMLCDTTHFKVPTPARTPWKMFRRILDTARQRAHLWLGAGSATRNSYLSLFRYYTGEKIFLAPRPGAEGSLGQEIQWFQREYKLHSGIEVCGIREVCARASHFRAYWFEPLCIRPELFALRQSYCERPVPISFRHHSISYRREIGDTFLPLLLSNSLPCDSIVCSSRAARAAILNLIELVHSRLPMPAANYNGRVDIIPFGVATEEFRPADKQACRRIFVLPRDAFIILYFGRVSGSDKADLLPLAIAFRQMRERVRGQRGLLVIAGNPRGRYLDSLRYELARLGLAEGVKFIGNVDDSEKAYLYGAADVFVSPSDSVQECFGLVVLEAMACGVPQVVSDWDGYRDLVVHGETGFLVPTMWADCDAEIIRDGIGYPGDWEVDHFQLGQSTCVSIEGLAEAFTTLAKNRDLQHRMAAASRARATAFYDWKTIVLNQEELWRELDAIASTLPESALSGPSYSLPSYFSCFRDYATTIVDESSQLALGCCGHRCSDKPLTLPYSGLLDGRDPFAGWDVSALLEAVRRVPGSIQVGQLLDAAGKSQSRAALLRQLMWLLKYGYLRVISEAHDRREVFDAAMLCSGQMDSRVAATEPEPCMSC